MAAGRNEPGNGVEIERGEEKADGDMEDGWMSMSVTRRRRLIAAQGRGLGIEEERHGEEELEPSWEKAEADHDGVKPLLR